jgi:glucuronokinase
MFGDAALGETNLAMITTARSVGAAAKFTGSGGAIVAVCPNGVQQEKQLQGEGGGGVLVACYSCLCFAF